MSDASFEIRPVFRWRSPRKQLAWMLPLLTFVIVTGDRPLGAQLRSLVVGLALGGLLLGLGWLSLRRSWIALVDGALVYRRGFRRARVVASDRASVSVVRLERAEDPGFFWQVWTGDGGAAALDERLWGHDHLAELAARLGVDLATEADPISPRELVRRYPGTMGWYVKHQVLATAAFAVFALGLGVAIDLVGS